MCAYVVIGPKTQGDHFCDRVSVPKEYSLFQAIGEYYPLLAWLIAKYLLDSDLDLYFAVLEGDLTTFNGNFPNMEALKERFCLTWRVEKSILPNKGTTATAKSSLKGFIVPLPCSICISKKSMGLECIIF